MLFYDTRESQILSEELRNELFHSLKSFVLATQHEEIQIETVRVLSNLSRHAKVCKTFVSEKSFIETLVVVLDNTLRDLVFYVIGILINVSLHEGLRRNVA